MEGSKDERKEGKKCILWFIDRILSLSLHVV